MMKPQAIAPIAAAILLAGVARAQDAPRLATPIVTVDGDATLDVRPDIATITLGAQDEARAPAEAIANVAKSSSAIVADLRSLGIEPSDIRTQDVLLTPVYAESVDPKTRETKSTVAGYRASVRLVARIRDVARAGSIVRHVAERGASSFDALDFSVSDAEAKIDGLRAASVANARRRAALYAQGAAMKLGRVISIEPRSDDAQSRAFMVKRAAAPSASASAIPIPVEPGLITLGAHVRAVWSLEPE